MTNVMVSWVSLVISHLCIFQETKWKIYLEVDADDDDDDDGGSEHNLPVTSLIKQVMFTSPQLPSNTVRVAQVFVAILLPSNTVRVAQVTVAI